MKRKGFFIDDVASLDNLYLAYYKAKRGKTYKREVISFSEKLDSNLKVLQKHLLTGNVEVGNYNYFKIYDPKERVICAASFPERVLHHAIMNVCHRYFDSTLIYDTYATRIGKGTYKAIERAMYGAKLYKYVLKLDVRKYFDSISHDVLKSKLRTLFKDPLLLIVFNKIIDSYSVNEGFGLPIGNLTSQYFANYYLSYIDHYMKEVQKVPLYVRYMDDILIFGDDKSSINRAYSCISLLMNEHYLQLKQPIAIKTYNGIPFLGYRIYPNKVLLSARSKKRFINKYIKYVNLLNNDAMSENDFVRHILPLFAFVQKAYTKKLRLNIMGRTE